ncbi:DUF1295 domain-containing protein [Paraglaciecola aestuariivivens]
MQQFFQALVVHSVVALLALGLVFAGSYEGQYMQLGAEHWKIFSVCALLAFVIQWIALIPAAWLKTEHFYDLTGGMTYLAVIAFAFWQSATIDARSILLCALVSIWALRLASFLFLRVRKQGKDSRFDQLKVNFWRFSITWTVQGLWVIFTAGAALAAITSTHQVAFDSFALVGLVIWLFGFSYQAIADEQKRRFKQQHNTQNSFIQSGLWAYSRHPNYFGEIVLWSGVAVIAYPALYGWQLVTLLSPLFVFVLLRYISGVSLQEEQAKARWGQNQAYQSYKASTPLFVPKIFG